MTGAYPAGLDLQAKHLLETATGSRVLHIAPILAGRTTYKFDALTSSGDRLILRIYPADMAAVANYEPDAWIALSQLGMKVPIVLAHTKDGPSFHLRYVLYQMVPGSSLSDRLADLDGAKLRRLARDVGTQLGYLSALPVRGFGDLSHLHEAACEDWHAFVIQAIDGCRACSAEDCWIPRLQEVGERLREQVGRIQAPPRPSLCWCDISPENIILTDHDELSGLVDFDGLLALEPLAAAGYFRARFFGSPFGSAFEEVWLEDGHDARFRVALYAVVRALRVAPYLGRPSPAGMSRDPLGIFLPGLETALEELHRSL